MKVGFWNARIIQKGEVYGLCAVSKYGSPLIQFYDTDYMRNEWPFGQPVSQYFVKTFMEIRGAGLDLQGDSLKWKMSRDEVKAYQDWIVACIGDQAYEEIKFE